MITDEFYLKWITNLVKIYIYLSEANKQRVLEMIESLKQANSRTEFETSATGIYAIVDRWNKKERWNPKTIQKEIIKIFVVMSKAKRQTGKILKWSFETKYKGIKMRSRLEAKWARFFDKQNIVWEYEPDLYQRDGLWYLPDFSLPKKKIIFEAKGEMNDKDELKKRMMAEICKEIGWRYVIGFSEIPKAYLIDPDGSQTEYLEWMEGE